MRRGALLGLVLAVALFALLSNGTENASAQSQALVSNIGQAESSVGGNLNTHNHAQAFTTGSNSLGYTLFSIDVNVSISDNDAEDQILAYIYSDSSGTPGNLQTTLTIPDISAAAGTQTITFTTETDEGFPLDADATYHFVLGTSSGGISGTPLIRLTTSNAEDSGAASGWSIADSGQSQPGIGTAWTSGDIGQIRINGVPKEPDPVLISNLGQADDLGSGLNFDQAQAFTTGGNGGGYTLTSADAIIHLNSDSTLSSKLTATIQSDSSGSPGTVVGTLTTPAIPTTTSNQTFNFAAPGDGIELAANTKYWWVLDTTGVAVGDASIRNTGSLTEDSGGADGFSITDDRWYRIQGDNFWNQINASVLKISINGVAQPGGEANLGDNPLIVALVTSVNTDATEGSSEDNAAIILALDRTLEAGETVTVPLRFQGGTLNTDFRLHLNRPKFTHSHRCTTFGEDTVCPEYEHGESRGVEHTHEDAKNVALSGQTVTFTGPTEIPGTLHYPALEGGTQVVISLTGNEDSDIRDERIRVSLGSLSSTGIGDGVTGQRAGSGWYTIEDNDKPPAAVTITETNGSTSVGENGGTDTYQVVLGSSPIHDVTITATSRNPGAVTVNKQGGVAGGAQTLTFTRFNWQTAQTITVTGVDDHYQNPGRSSTITHTASSRDAKYNRLSVRDVVVTVTDDGDTATEVVGPRTLSMSIEGGHTDIDEDGFRTLVFTLNSPAPSGGVNLGDLGSPSGADIIATGRVIPAGKTSIEYPIRVHDDADYTPSRTVTYTFPNRNSLRTSGSLRITLSVNDDDSGPPVPAGQIPRNAKIFYWGDLEDDDPGGYAAGAIIHLPVPRFIQNNDRYQRAILLRIQGHKMEDDPDDKRSFGAAMCGRVSSTYGFTKYATFINTGPTIIGDHVIEDDQRWPLYRMQISNGMVKLPVHLCPGSKGETIIVTWTDINNYTSSNQPGFDRNVPQTENTVPWNYNAPHCRRASDPDRWGHQCQTVVTIGDPDGSVPSGDHLLSQVNIMGSSTGPEGEDAEFILMADPAPEAPLKVKVQVTATGDFGVTTGPQTVTIPTRGYVSFRVPTTDDDVDERDGTVTLTLQADRRYTIGPESTATGMIFDNDLTLGGLKLAQGSPPSKPEVSVTGVIGGEEGEDVIFFLEADPPPSIPTAVLLKVTATGDYRVKTGTRIISLPAGSGHAHLRIPTRDDGVDEPDGTVTVALQAGHAYTVGAVSSQTGHILDNDTTPKVSVADAIAQEGDDLEFVISLSYPVNGPVTVYYNTLDWYAWSPEDYASVFGWAIIPAGDTEATVRVPTVVDDLDEENEKMVLDISGIEGGGAVLGDVRADGIISDDPVDTTPKPELSISGGSGITEGGTATFAITASFAPEDPITVKVGVSQSGDFGVNTGTKTVTVSGVSTTYTVSTHNDSNDEPNGSVTATLKAGSGYTVSSSNGAATVSVADDDLPPPVASITGGNGITEGGTASFTITVNPAPSSPITVKVGVSQSGNFGVSTGTKTVTVSGGTATYTVTTTDDNADEPDGSVTATLQSGSGYTVSSSNGAATVSVADDDATPEVNVTSAVSGPEGQDVTFTLTANPAPGANLPVSVTVTASGNYGVSTGTWVETIPTGGSVVVTLTTTDDSADEPDGSVTLTVNGGSGYTVGSLSSETVTVTDNDEPRQPLLLPDPEVSITAGSGITEGGTATFTITANPAPSSPITVKVGVSENGDFGASGAATVTVSGASTTYTVTTTDDSTDEADGSVTATLQTGSGYTVSSSQGAASVAVSDDDVPEVSITAGSGIIEGGIATFTITANPAPASPITVKVGVSENGDFGASGAATVTVSGASATYTVTTINDNADEADGSVTATLQSGSGYTVSSSQGAASVAVSDDDVPEVSITAGGGITEGGTATFTITASPAPASPITVKVGVSENGDFGASGAATVTVSGASTTYTVTTTNDSADEADGSVTATLQTGSGYTVSSSQGAATVAVSDDDVPEVSITAGSGIIEGGTATFTITANPAPASPITVKVGVSETGDFGASGSATVTVSGASTTYTVTTTDDNADEADGSVTATLQSGSGYTVSSSQGAATVAVSDDDVSTDNSDTLTVSVEDSESAGPGEFLRFTVSASETAQQDVTVTFRVENIGLVQGLDYCILSSDEEPDANFRCMGLPYGHDNEGGQVTIAAGEDSATVYIWIDRDARVPSGQPQIFVDLTEVDGAKEITDGLGEGRVTR